MAIEKIEDYYQQKTVYVIAKVIKDKHFDCDTWAFYDIDLDEWFDEPTCMTEDIDRLENNLPDEGKIYSLRVKIGD